MVFTCVPTMFAITSQRCKIPGTRPKPTFPNPSSKRVIYFCLLPGSQGNFLNILVQYTFFICIPLLTHHTIFFIV